jgi:hypothetical protein
VPPDKPTPNEQRLLGLCRRLLRQNEDVHAHNQDVHAQVDRLYGVIRFLGEEYRALRTKFDRAEREHIIKEESADVLFGAALDELASGSPQGKPR